MCNGGLHGDGFCFCAEGWTGERCEVRLGEGCQPLTFPMRLTAGPSGLVPPTNLQRGSGAGSRAPLEHTRGSLTCTLVSAVKPTCSPPCHPQASCRAGNLCECDMHYEGDGRACTGGGRGVRAAPWGVGHAGGGAQGRKTVLQ